MNPNHLQKQIISCLSEFNNKEPEIKFIWKDPFSSATGYLVINSIKNGAAAGGTRLNNNIKIEEIINLAKIMEIKLKGNLDVGGAKSGIKYDPSSNDRSQVLKRWFKAISPILREYYGTAGDLNVGVDQISHILRDLKINNYLEGVINAACLNDSKKRKKIYHALNYTINQKVNLAPNVNIKLLDLCTGFGIAQGIFLLSKLIKFKLENKKAYVQGVGVVGWSAMYYLKKFGVKIVSLSNIDGGLIYKNGIDEAALVQIIRNSSDLKKIDNFLPLKKFNSANRKMKFDIFVPAAASRIVTLQKMQQYVSKNGLKIIACGANNPFVEKDYIYGECSQEIDKKITLIPDFFINSGVALAFRYMIENYEKKISPQMVFDYISKKIDIILKRSLKKTKYSNLYVTASLLFDYLNIDPLKKRKI